MTNKSEHNVVNSFLKRKDVICNRIKLNIWSIWARKNKTVCRTHFSAIVDMISTYFLKCARKTVNKPEVNGQSPIFSSSFTKLIPSNTSSRARKNVANAAPTKKKMKNPFNAKTNKKKMNNALRRQERMTTNHHLR